MPDHFSKILILIPAYNAANHLEELIERIRKIDYRVDLLVINDGSTDSTENIITELEVGHLSHTPNRGKGYALKRGFEYAIEHGYDHVITIDADLQHLPEELMSFLSYNQPADISIGTRTIDLKKVPPHRWLTNNMTSLIISIFYGTRVRDSQSGFRMIVVDLIKKLKVSTVKYDFESEMLFQAGLLKAKITEIPITTVYEGSRSYFNPLADVGRFIKLVWKRIWL